MSDFKKWNQWLDRIYDQVEELLVRDYIYNEVQKIIQANSRIQKASLFYQWMGSVYAAATSIGIRRQLDPDKRSISLRRLLEEILKKPKVLSRQMFVSSYCSAVNEPETLKHMQKLANTEFDTFAGQGNTYVDSSLVQGDIDELITKLGGIKDFVNKRVAHTDKQGPSHLPTFEEVRDCLKFLKTLVEKYALILRGRNGDMLPVIITDWRGVFREPWITPEFPFKMGSHG